MSENAKVSGKRLNEIENRLNTGNSIEYGLEIIIDYVCDDAKDIIDEWYTLTTEERVAYAEQYGVPEVVERSKEDMINEAIGELMGIRKRVEGLKNEIEDV